MAVIAVAVKAR